MKKWLWAGILVLLLASGAWAKGKGISRDTRQITFASAPTVIVTGDENKDSDSILVPSGVFNGVSVTLRFQAGSPPNVIPRLQLLSPIDGAIWTENHFDPILTTDDAAVTAVGTYIFDIRFPVVARIRIRLDGELGSPATTVSGAVTFQ